MDNQPSPPVDVSICIPTLNAARMLRDCLLSIPEQTRRVSYEIIVCDNASQDGTIEMLQREFANVAVIQNSRNEGFTRPINQMLRRGKGRHYLLLNPDTLILPEAIDRLVDYMDSHPEAGIVGPKVLNSDGTFQMQCRRGVSRPWSVVSYFLGLYKLFPKSKFFGGYLLNYLDEDKISEVDGVAGSCMLIRGAVIQQIGYLDEAFFAYQEDADYCFQAQKAGWKVIYLPTAKIIHYGGQGGTRAYPYRSILEWHRSYYLYYRKNLAKDYFFLFNWLFYLAMLIKFLSAVAINLIRKEKFAGPRRPAVSKKAA